MLTGKQVVFLGGDARQLEVCKRFIEMNTHVSLMGYDNLQTPLSGAIQRELTPENLRKVDILVLPIVGTDDEGNISSVFTSKKILLTSEHFKALPKKCFIFTGIARPYLKNLCKDYGLTLFELMKRDDVAIYNSIPTVEGALMMAIQNTDITIHGSECAVLGFGRVGLSLARALHSIGAKVKVGVRCPGDFARAFEMGLEAFDTQFLEDNLQNTEVIFNTVPALILTEEVLLRVPYDTVIIDLASKPGGVDYSFAEKRGIKAILAPSLPGIVAPKTAGKILAQTITNLVVETIERGEN